MIRGITVVVDVKEHSCATIVYSRRSYQGFVMLIEAILYFQTFDKPQSLAICSVLGETSKNNSLFQGHKKIQSVAEAAYSRTSQ